MSLIEEALRKVQDPTLRAFPGTAQQQERPARAKPSAQAQAQVAPAPVAAHSWSPAPAQPSSAAPNNSALIAVAIGVLGLTAALIMVDKQYVTLTELVNKIDEVKKRHEHKSPR